MGVISSSIAGRGLRVVIPGCEKEEIISGLAMSSKTVTALLQLGCKLIGRSGKGIKGDPYKYYASPICIPESNARKFMANDWTN